MGDIVRDSQRLRAGVSHGLGGLYFPPLPKNRHMERIAEKFGGLAPDSTVLPSTVRYVFLCFTNRCGSNYFAELLASGGNYNAAGEALNWDAVCSVADRLRHTSFHAYFAWLIAKHARSDMLFIKVALPQIEMLGHAGILEQIQSRSTFVLIERSDKLGQAISHILAFATKRFIASAEPAIPEEEVEFSAAKIDTVMESLARSYRAFDLFFSFNGIVPIQVNYENMLADTISYINIIANRLGLTNFRVDQSKIKLQRQAGAVNANWRKQYLGRFSKESAGTTEVS